MSSLRAVAICCLNGKNKMTMAIRKELHISDVIIRIKDYQTKWLESMEHQRIPTIVSKYSSADKRTRKTTEETERAILNLTRI
jgi:hypothetical protein